MGAHTGVPVDSMNLAVGYAGVDLANGLGAIAYLAESGGPAETFGRNRYPDGPNDPCVTPQVTA
ncbi:hypothetical protein ACFTWF_37055 [Rhodococcus sp. NPDC056960]|uniref:hypothetical protein n=1 Tax=Rhodococcus sp. NPDC056960 TaxID=3345982 RepID=UPI0036295275